MDSDGEDDRPPLLRAAYAGDVHALRRAIADGADLNVEGEIDDDTAIRSDHGPDDCRTRVFAALLRAGAKLPEQADYMFQRADMPPYINAVAKAGGYARYERAHCELLAAIFMPKPEADKGRRRSKRRRRRSRLQGLPVEVMHHIVSILWDCGGHCEGPLFSYL